MIPGGIVTSALADESIDGMAAVDRELRVVYCNPAMARMLGVSVGEIVGRCVSMLPALQAAAGGDDPFRRALRGEVVEIRDRPFLAEDGDSRRFYDTRYAPCRDASGALAAVVVIVRDVTERKRIDDRLEETESRFRSMADASPVLLWTAGSEALRTFFNKTWLEFTGRALAQECGVGWVESVHPDDVQACMDTYIGAFCGRRPFEMEYRLRHADGQYRAVLERGTPRYACDRRFAGFIGSCVDLTDRRRAESDLREAVRARDEFLSVASHELRTPLTALQLQLENLMRAVQRAPGEALTTGRLERTTVSAVAQSARMAALIEEMLDVSRIAEGRLPLAYEDVDLAALVRASVERAARFPADGGSAIEVRAEGPQPGRWDRARVEQVMNHLLSNAIKYGDRKPIVVALNGDGEHVRLVVKDCGIGISRAHQQRIFERFERAVSTHNYGGLGLGLWTCRRVVEAMGGEIGVDSEPGHGAAFTVTLPRFPRDPVRAARGPGNPAKDAPAVRREAPPARTSASES